MRYLPIAVDIQRKTVLVVGAGVVAERKVGLLLQAGAIVRVVAPEIKQSLKDLVSQSSDSSICQRKYQVSDMEGVSMVIAATSNSEVNSNVSSDALALKIPINVVDCPGLCSFIFPSIIDRDPLLISVCSSGASPVLARYVRSKIEDTIPQEYHRLASFLKEHRDIIREAVRESYTNTTTTTTATLLPIPDQPLASEDGVLPPPVTAAAPDLNKPELLSTDSISAAATDSTTGTGEGEGGSGSGSGLNKSLYEQNRRDIWDQILEGPISSKVLNGRPEEAAEMLQKLLQSFMEQAKIKPADQNRGEVFLVGAGPGDPELLTLKALHLLRRADVIVYDRLIPSEVLSRARRDCEKIYVGKSSGTGGSGGLSGKMTQDMINRMLVDLAKAGKRVCRLKGGDPFIFGRGGEEILALREANIPYTIVPGISASNGCACVAGIPLTHRNLSNCVLLVTGRSGGEFAKYDWNALAHTPLQTIVFYMGLSGVTQICEELLQHGMKETMPVAVVSCGTLPNQQIFTGTLKGMRERSSLGAAVEDPALIIIGEVVQLHKDWHGELSEALLRTSSSIMSEK